MKKIIITGPTGAIGIALIRHCIRAGIEVTAVCRPGSRRKNRIPINKNVNILECSLDNLTCLPQVIDTEYDTFYHLGWSGTTGKARMEKNEQMENVNNTMRAVEVAQKLGCHTFVGAGSQAEYGRVEGKLSQYTPTHPETWYGKAKLIACTKSREKCKEYHMRHIWTRILSVYGPGDNEDSMIMTTVRNLLSGSKPMLTKGEQRWDYISCQDAAKALYLLGEKGLDGKIYCIGSGMTKPLIEYVQIIRNEINPQAELGIGEIPYSDKQVMHLCADITELKEDTGFEPEVPFQEGIREVIRWCKEHEREG